MTRPAWQDCTDKLYWPVQEIFKFVMRTIVPSYQPPSRKSTALPQCQPWRYAKLVLNSWTGILIRFLFIFFSFRWDLGSVIYQSSLIVYFSKSHVMRKKNTHRHPDTPPSRLDRQTPIRRCVLDLLLAATALNNGKRGETGKPVSWVVLYHTIVLGWGSLLTRFS